MKTLNRFLSLLLILALCLSLAGTASASSLSQFAALANDGPSYSSTRSFMAAMEANGLSCEFDGKNDGGDETVYAVYPGEYCEEITIAAFFSSDEDDVYFRIWNLIDFSSSDTRELLGKVNELNKSYNFAVFLLDTSDYSVTVELDALLPEDGGELCLQYLLLLGRIADNGYHALEAYKI